MNKNFPIRYVCLCVVEESPKYDSHNWYDVHINSEFLIYRILSDMDTRNGVPILLFDFENEIPYHNGFTQNDLDLLNQDILGLDLRLWCIDTTKRYLYPPFPINFVYFCKFMIMSSDFFRISRNKKIEKILF